MEVLRSGRLSLGPTIDAFEEVFAEVVGAPYAAAVSSGTAGLHLLCVSAGVGPGDEVITSPYSFVASANCAIYEGATPVFADIDRRTLNLDPAAVEAAITERTRAVVAVDIYGYPCELDELRAICERHGLALDRRRLRGARRRATRARRSARTGASSVFAFYPNKQITTGEGGMVTTHSEEEWRLVRSLRNQGRADSGGWLDHARLGFNYRLDDVRAAIGIGQLEKLDEILAARCRCGCALLRSCSAASTGSSCRARTTPTTRARGSSTSSRSRPAPTARPSSRISTAAASRPRAISRASTSRRTCASATASREGLCPVAEEMSSRTLALPFHARIEEDDQAYVASAMWEALAASYS